MTAALAAALPQAQAQTVTFDTADYGAIGVYDTWEQSPFRNGALQGNVAVTANPLTAVDDRLGFAPDTTACVLGFQRSRYGSNTFGARVDLKQPFALTTTTRYVHVLIHKPKAGRSMLIGLGKRTDRPGQSPDVEQFWAFSTNTVGPGEWVDAVFPIKGAAGVEIHSLVVVPDCEPTHDLDADFLCYIDGIEVNDNPLTATQRDDYPLNFSSTQTYTRGDRGLTAIRLGAQTATVAATVSSGSTPVYRFIDNASFAAKPGESVQPAFTYKGTWMSGYVYVDYDNDGRFSSSILPSGVPTDSSDLKSYSYYSATGGQGRNSKGQTVANGNNVSGGAITPPAFTIPDGLAYGFYRMRYKVDWNDLDAGGSIVSGNDIVGNGGAIADIRLNVHPDEVTISDEQRNGDVLDATGSALGYKIPFGKAFTIKMRPENGFTYSGVRIRHGYNLSGDSLVHSTPQYVDVVVKKSAFGDDDTYTIPAAWVDGDIVVEGLFVSGDSPVEEDFYPVAFDKATDRTRTDRVLNGISLAAANFSVPEPTRMYNDLTARSFVVRPGETVDPGFSYTGRWMDGYVYIDKNRNGFFDAAMPEAQGALQPDNDLVAFSGLTLADGTAYNSAGTRLSNLSAYDPPAFTIPDDMEEGFYMMRYKIDWDSYLPEGRVDESNNIIANGGGIVDVRLCVTSGGSATVSVDADHGSLSLADGTPLAEARPALGEAMTVLAAPDAGYRLERVVLRHGNLSGDSISNHVAQYADAVFEGSAVDGGMMVIPGSYVDGDLRFTALFSPADDDEQVYRLVFDDEFNQPDGTQPDPARWASSARRNATWNRFVADDARVHYVEDSALVLKAIPNTDKATDSADMLTGAMETQGKFGFQYGRIDVRFKTEHHTGNFPAVWMMPVDNSDGWPNDGEIDIFETIDNQNKSYHTVHTNWTYNLKHTGDPRSSASVDIDVTQWHVYSFEWEATQLRWYIDGEQVFSYDKSASEDALANGQWPFDRSFYVIVNQSVGNGSWAAQADTRHTYTSWVDYVRVYQKQPATGIAEVAVRRPADGAVYTLQGMRVDGRSLPKGIYIRGGSKFVVR